MEQSGSGKMFRSNVIGTESRVGAGPVKEQPVHSRRADYDAVRRSFAVDNNHIFNQRIILTAEYSQDGFTEEVITDFTDQPC